MYLHVTNGTSTARTLGAAGLGGAVTDWFDLLHEGPVPATSDEDELYVLRARYLAESGFADFDEALGMFRRRDEALRRHVTTGDEVVLWCEHDLYDQLILVRMLAWLLAIRCPPERVHLVCIGDFPGVERFVGLGQLTSPQLASLFPARASVGTAAFELARTAWTAFQSSDPTTLERLSASGCPALPFLAAALERLLDEYPSTANGLGRTEQAALEQAATPLPPDALFQAVGRREERPFLGDAPFYSLLRRLAALPHPLLQLEGTLPGVGPIAAGARAIPEGARVVVTALGRDVARGGADAVQWNGIDRWIGGVHLHGADAAWRWDRRQKHLVAT